MIGWQPSGQNPIWIVPAFLGVLLILLGILLYKMPELLAYVVAGLLVFAGVGLLGSAWRLRRSVSYRRIHSFWEQSGDDSGAQ